MLLLAAVAVAEPVDTCVARRAGNHFLMSKGLLEANESVTLCATLSSSRIPDPCAYVFNVRNEGFILVAADDRCVPILGYSLNGAYDAEKLPGNMRAWLNGCCDDIARGILDQAPFNDFASSQWKKLLSDSYSVVVDPKSDDYLITSTWAQGSGYNEYCPKMNGQHVVVGCVATAMAQIIRYYQYPLRGFGRKSYSHQAYGTQAVDFDTTDYDYSLMPNRLGRSATHAQKDMVSRLCYHCGVVVNMEYQHAGHTSGSGAHTSHVVDGLQFFGYTDARHFVRANVNDDALWTAMIREEIDHRRPIEYSGHSSEGGHAFILDGYNNQGQYHFNWGWDGYCDGFYALTTMVGYTSSHEMVTHIQPSGWDGHLAQFHVSPDGTGSGVSWSQANGNLAAAIALNKLVNREVWVLEGTYYGDTASEYAFSFNNPVTIIGGFAGTETSVEQLSPDQHPTIFDGLGQHAIFRAVCNSSASRSVKISNIIFQNGYSLKGQSVFLSGNVNASNFIIRDCRSDSGNVLRLNGCLMRYSSLYGNQAPVVCSQRDAVVRQSLVCNNEGIAIELLDGSRLVNSTVASNAGLGLAMGDRSSSINNILWNNDTNIVIRGAISDTSLRYCAIGESLPADTSIVDSTLMVLPLDNEASDGTHFVNPSIQRGMVGDADGFDWHLNRGSACINAGERLAESVLDGDKDHSLRCRNGAIDLGCYESRYNVSLEEPQLSGVVLYPNPTVSVVTVSGYDGSVKLFDVMGRGMLTADVQSEGTRLDLSSLPKGIYFLRVGAASIRICKE